MKVDFKRVVLTVGSEKGCPRLCNEYWFGLNGGRSSDLNRLAMLLNQYKQTTDATFPLMKHVTKEFQL